ncbi:MAG: flagellin hook IN motif-containing protein [Faecalimonas sp.]|nr:flagellin hook IN motif-containing protein [Faecalimonas sp.]
MNLYGTARAIAGQKYGLQDVVESHVAAENIEPGAALFGKVGDDRVFNAHKNVVALVASANLVTGNKLAAKVNGVELDEVDFDTDTDTTLAALAEAINSNESLSEAGISASVVEGSKTITITGETDVTGSV